MFSSENSNNSLLNYSYFAENCIKNNKYDLENNEPTLIQGSNIFVDNIEKDITELSEGDYDILIKEFAVEPITYDKYEINYLYPVVPGKVSIVMIISQTNDNFPNVLKDIRAQNVGLIEYIIIDNNAGFRNNVKPVLRYGQKMPLEFCKYHAKEFCTGEYMIFLTEDSPSFSVSDYLEKGLYDIR